MDYNRWHGDKADLMRYVGKQTQPVICPLDGEVCPVKVTVVED
jgi:hypothetical protein